MQQILDTFPGNVLLLSAHQDNIVTSCVSGILVANTTLLVFHQVIISGDHSANFSQHGEEYKDIYYINSMLLNYIVCNGLVFCL